MTSPALVTTQTRLLEVALPESSAAKIGFLKSASRDTRAERVDSLDPDTFRYKISTREVTA